MYFQKYDKYNRKILNYLLKRISKQSRICKNLILHLYYSTFIIFIVFFIIYIVLP